MEFTSRNKGPRWTRSKIELPRLPPRLTEFDDKDHTPKANGNDSNILALEGRVPNYLLLVSLLEVLCSLYESNSEKSSQIFNVVCRELSKMKVMPAFSFLEEFGVIRSKYKMAFNDLMQAAAKSVNGQGAQLVWPPQLRSNSYQHPAWSLGQEWHCRQSRYGEEFEEIGRLGKGGFGSVVKVRNRLDGREYAIKKVTLKEADPELSLKILREVKVLARLNHVNVVGYHAAWLEYVTATQNSAIPRVTTHPVSLRELDDVSSRNGAYRNDTSNSNSIIFEGSSSSGGIVFSIGDNDDLMTTVAKRMQTERSKNGKIPTSAHWKNSGTFMRGSPYPAYDGIRRSASSSSLGSLLINEKSESSIPPAPRINKQTLGMMLFIQMQLCTTTLRDWLIKRNENLLRTGGDIDPVSSMTIFRQILEGVRYIHLQSLMHRDLKPRNIFLQNLTKRKEDTSTPLQVKIGDFGLARKDAVAYPENSSPLATLIEPLTPLFPSLTSPMAYNGHTAGVGTCTYASPEQLRNSVYDNSADIYSLGIILFELFHPFVTEMERVTCIKNLRQGRLLDAFTEKWPKQSKLILNMVAAKPSDRPSAESILKLEFVKDRSEVCKQLGEAMEMQAKEIEELKSVLLVKDLELEEQMKEKEHLQRELAERDELINRLLANKRLCAACGQNVQSVDTNDFMNDS